MAISRNDKGQRFVFDFSESYEYNKRMPENHKKSEPT